MIIDTRPDYPPEFDGPDNCLVCGTDCDKCSCPECPECASVGDPNCYGAGHLKPMPDSVASLVQHLGLGETLTEAFRAIDRHSTPSICVTIELADGQRFSSGDLSVFQRLRMGSLAPYTRIFCIGVGGIAWDGSDWEWYDEAAPDADWACLHKLEEDFADALAEWDEVRSEG